jgi:tRNA modification GTPase
MGLEARGDVETIVAAASPPGRGGVGVVRISGPLVPEIARALLGELPAPRRAALEPFRAANGEPIDAGIALYFPEPRSYTGEHVLELQGHGGPVVMEALVERVTQLGARRARPGEFTERAFLNDKIDLAQAEAVADLIDAGSVEAARAAMRSLQGEFSVMVQGLTEAVIELRTWIEAAIDFPEEDIDFLATLELGDRVARVCEHFDAVQGAARQGRLLREGLTIVIAGRPNAGKSSLLNRLAGYDAAIVTPVPGTTRDVVRERIQIDGMPLHVLDTAGLHDAPADEVEAEGIRRTRGEIARADRVLFVVDAATDPQARSFAEERASLPKDVPVTLVLNKCDVASGIPMADTITITGPRWVAISARTGEGLDMLRDHLKQCVGYVGADAGTVLARARHIDALGRARAHVEEAVRVLRERRAGELVAEELKLAQRCLDEITGAFSSDDLLGRIFSSFCIGK